MEQTGDRQASTFKRRDRRSTGLPGVRPSTQTEPAKFLEKRAKVLASLEKARSEVLELGAPEFGIRTFGDSILLDLANGHGALRRRAGVW